MEELLHDILNIVDSEKSQGQRLDEIRSLVLEAKDIMWTPSGRYIIDDMSDVKYHMMRLHKCLFCGEDAVVMATDDDGLCTYCLCSQQAIISERIDKAYENIGAAIRMLRASSGVGEAGKLADEIADAIEDARGDIASVAYRWECLDVDTIIAAARCAITGSTCVVQGNTAELARTIANALHGVV